MPTASLCRLMIEATHAEFEKEWRGRATETRPANRTAAEAAAARFYECVGFLGSMKSVLWAESFPELASMVRLMDRGVGWHVLYSFLKTADFVEPDPMGCGTALTDAFRSFQNVEVDKFDSDEVDFEIEKVDEYEEGDEIEYVTFSLPPAVLLPSIYAPARLADFQHRIASGALPSTGMQKAMLDILRECPAFYPLPGVALLCDNPACITPFGMSSEGLPIPGIAIKFRSGYLQHFWHGHRVRRSEAKKLAQPNLLTCRQILEDFAPEIQTHLIAEFGAQSVARGAGAAIVLNLTDTELRRQLIEAYGPKDLIFDDQVSPLTVNDDFGTLFRIKVSGDEDLCVVKVLNATPEPDGTFRDYFLRVPPNVQTAQEAVAWTFEIEEGYAPIAQT